MIKFSRVHLAAGALLTFVSAATAVADVHVGIGIGLPAVIPPPVYYGPPPAYYSPPPPVYYGPGVVYGRGDWDWGGDPRWRGRDWAHDRWHGDWHGGDRGDWHGGDRGDRHDQDGHHDR